MAITETETKFLNELVKDCITYGLEEKEALGYIKLGLSEYRYPHTNTERHVF
jgi:hypothetical protein